MKEILNFTLEEVLIPQSDRFQPHMQEVVSFLTKLSSQLSPCVSLSFGSMHLLPPSSLLSYSIESLWSAPISFPRLTVRLAVLSDITGHLKSVSRTLALTELFSLSL